MAASLSTVGAVNRVPLNLNGAGAGSSVPSSAFFGSSLKKINSKIINQKLLSGNFKVSAEYDEQKQTSKDRWGALASDTSDDQQDITRGKGMVDSVFQAPMGTGTHNPIMSSSDYISQGLRQYMDNNMDGFYIAPAFMDKIVVHITKNFLNLPNIKVPLILGIWGGKGQGKSFQCELVFAKMGISPIMMSAGELESGNAGEPAKLIRQRYREAADIIKKKGKMCCLFINDLDAGAGRLGGTTQYTVNNQMVNATLMNIADNPTNVQLPGIFRTDNVPKEDIVKLVDTFPGQSIDFFGAIRARVYDDEVRKWISSIGVENVGKRLVNSLEGPPTFDQPKMTLEKLLEYGNMLVSEQENVKRVQLADKYLKEAALGDANEDAMNNGSFYGKAAQQVSIPVPEGCTDPSLKTLIRLLGVTMVAASINFKSVRPLRFAVSCQPSEIFFTGFKGVDTNITLSGVAEIGKNGVLRLTNETSRLMGHAFYTSPFQFKNSSNGKAFSFSTSFAFVVVPEYPKLGGHGLAFAISTSKDLKALPSQYLGLLNASDSGNFTNHLLAVEFDTVQDFEFEDINDNHVGIDINSLKSNASAPAAYYSDDFSKQDLNLKGGYAIQVWIDYDSVQNLLNVTLSPTSKKARLPILSFPIDLSPIFKEHMVVGTLGYLAPELPRTGKATASSDVYAFGALLLEVACGRRPIEPKALPEEMVLVDLVWERFREGKVLDVVDPRLNGQYNESEMVMVLKLGLMCSNNVSIARPTMRQVIMFLDGERQLPESLRTLHGAACADVEKDIIDAFDDFGEFELL
ncbi:hypothetical protein GH714_014899 [Hevea brasiliensis]|uniref:Ribulose bisphosphate carboxylase/oxygenase activase, chloroplastic n=1 Tax=Hevea brasiliensis TaxID=3981 RepID=A0A6A6LYS2_HEVBR|nr:hypothetical protein GH714_014899 [Hevea brasiliensis]